MQIRVTRTVPGEIRVDGAEVRVLGEEVASRADLLSFIEGAEIIVSMFHDRIDTEALEAAGPSLKGVCNFAVGVNNIDLDACRERGIVVTNTPDAVTEGTANIAWLLIMACARRLIEADRYARSEAFPARGNLGMAEFMGIELTGKTLLIVGAGRIGYATAIRSLGWGMEVLYTARSRHWEFELGPLHARRVSLEEGLREADVVSVHTPLTPETRHLINAARLAMMKETAILVNTARGPVVEEAALVEALREGRLWGAGLDVFEEEPKVHPGLIDLANTVLTPHIGSAERRYREEMTAMVCESATAILRGEDAPRRVV